MRYLKSTALHFSAASGAWLVAAGVLLAAPVAFGQTTGISKPSAAVVLTDDAPTPAPTPALNATSTAAAPSEHRVVMIDGHKVTLLSREAPVRGNSETDEKMQSAANDPNADVVTSVPSRANELPDGTVLRVAMGEAISTRDSVEGRSFTARTIEDVTESGKVIIPAGSEMQGRIVRLTAGRRINGQASIRLRPDTVVLPDGSRYLLHATAIDTDPSSNNRVDSEGAIIDKGHGKRDALILGGATAGSAAVGAAFAGPPGAIIGAGVGAGVATTHWLLEEHDATLAKSTLVVFQLTEPMQITPLRTESEAVADPLLQEKH